MKINKIILVGVFFLTILTLGAVSASQDLIANETENSMELTLDDGSNAENQLTDENANLEDTLAVSEEPKLEDGRRYAPDELYNDIDFDEQFSVQEFWHSYDYYDNPKETVSFKSDGLMNGVMTLYFDNQTMFRIPFTENETNYYAEYTFEWFDDGVHTWMLEYVGDNYYSDFIRNGTFEIIWAKIPKVVEPGNGNDFIELKLGDSNVPAVLEIINGTGSISKLNSTLNKISLSNLKSGTYNYTLSHTNFHKYRGTFTVLPAMFLKTESVYRLADSINLTAVLPEIQTGNISVFYNNKTYCFEIENGTAIISVENKVLGSNKIAVTYDDGKYGLITREKNIITQWKTLMPEYVEFGSEEYVILELPSDANGTLSVFYRYRNENKEYVDVIIGNSTMYNGHANVSLANLEIGTYTIYAYYLDDDKYEGYSFGTVYVHPKIDVPQTAIVNQNCSVSIEVSEGMGGTLIVYNHYESPYGAGSSDIEIGSSAIQNNSASVTFPCLREYGFFMVEYKSENYTFSRIYPIVVKENPELELAIDDIYENQTLNVGISINANASGEIIFSINNVTYPIDLTNGIASFVINNLTEGVYCATVKYGGDDCFNASEVVASFKVIKLETPVNETKLDPNLSVGVVDVNASEIVVVNMSIDENATGNVILTFNNVEYEVDVSNGKGVFEIADLAAGEYEVSVRYAGDEGFNDSEVVVSFKVIGTGPGNGTNSSGNATGNGTNVTKLSPGLNVVVGDVNVSETVIVDIFINANATGKVTLVFDDVVNDVVMSAGEGGFEISGLPAGDYSILVKYVGDDYFTSDEMSVSFKVIGAAAPGNNTNASGNATEGNETQSNTTDNNVTVVPEMTIPALDEVSDNQTVTIALPGDATGTVTLDVNDKKYVFEVKNGVAVVSIPQLDGGNYNYTITYSGNGKYSSTTKTGSMKVNNEKTNNTTVEPEITVPPLDNPSDDGTVTVSLPIDATGNVTLLIDGKVYSSAAVENGQAKVNIPNLGDGNYQYSIRYSGDNKYSPIASNGTLNINNANGSSADNKTNNAGGNTSKDNITVPDPVIDASDAKAVYAAGFYYTVTIFESDGKPANGTSVVIRLNGETFKTMDTDANGVVKFKVTQLPGKYTLTITALNKTKTAKLTVKHIVKLNKVKVKRSAKKLVLTATLKKNANGKYLKKKKVTFRFNGKKYNAKTNNKGLAKVTIKSSVLSRLPVGKMVNYQATYKKDTIKKSSIIKK